MCILIVKPAGVKLPAPEILFNCHIRNSHGCGYAVPGKRPYKTTDYSRFIEHIGQEDENEPMIIHFRLATHGSIKKSNCHPFFNHFTGVSFAHNGILDIEPLGDLTDSETAFKTIFVPAIVRDGGIMGDCLARAVNDTIGTSKFAFMDPDGNVRMCGNFIYNDDGIYYSNYSFANYNMFCRR